MKRLIPIILILILMAAPVNAREYSFLVTDYKILETFGVPVDFKAKLEKLKPLAEQGDTSAQFQLGEMIAEGLGIKQDFQEAVKWYKLSAEQGNDEAQYTLGVSYEEGHGVTQNYQEAVKWYKLQTEQGYGLAQYKLGVMYLNGQGVSQDYVQAYKWLDLSWANGYTEGHKQRDILEKSLSVEQLNEAKKLSLAWMWEHQELSKLFYDINRDGNVTIKKFYDINRDGKLTISDIWFVLKFLYFYPGNFIASIFWDFSSEYTLFVFSESSTLAEFLEISEDDMGGSFSSFISHAFWVTLIIGLVVSETVENIFVVCLILLVLYLLDPKIAIWGGVIMAIIFIFLRVENRLMEKRNKSMEQ